MNVDMKRIYTVHQTPGVSVKMFFVNCSGARNDAAHARAAKVCAGTYCGRAAVPVAVGEELIEHHPKAPDVRSHRELALSQRLGCIPATMSTLVSKGGHKGRWRNTKKPKRSDQNMGLSPGSLTM